MTKFVHWTVIIMLSGVIAFSIPTYLKIFGSWLNTWPQDNTTKWQASDLPELLSGDIILQRHPFASSRLMRLGLHSYWNHSAIILRDGHHLVENGTDGVVIGDLWDKTNCPIAIYRVPDLSSAQRQDIATYAMQTVGSKNDWGIALRVIRHWGWQFPVEGARTLWALWTDKDHTPLPHTEDEYFLCSEIIQEVYAKAGIPLIDDQYLLLPKQIVFLERQGKLIRVFGPDRL